MENNDTVTKRQLGREKNSAQAKRPIYRFDRPAIEHRLLPYSKVGAKFWYRAEDIDDLLARNLRGCAIVEVQNEHLT